MRATTRASSRNGASQSPTHDTVTEGLAPKDRVPDRASDRPFPHDLTKTVVPLFKETQDNLSLGEAVTIQIAIVGDIRLYCEGLARVLSDSREVTVVALLSDPAIVAERVHKLSPPVVLVDAAMPNALETIRCLHDTVPDTRIVALGVSESRAEICRCAESGVSGFVPRDASLKTLVRTMRLALKGEVACSPRTAGYLLRRVSSLASRSGDLDLVDGLTQRQMAVLEQLSAGRSNKEIARNLGIEVATVKNHVHQILEKLHVHRRGEAAAMWARRHPFATHGDDARGDRY